MTNSSNQQTNVKSLKTTCQIFQKKKNNSSYKFSRKNLKKFRLYMFKAMGKECLELFINSSQYKTLNSEKISINNI